MAKTTRGNGVEKADPATLEELEKAKTLLRGLLQDTGVKMERAEATRRQLQGELEAFRESFQENMGRMNVFRQEELWVRLRNAEAEARKFDQDLAALRKEYDWMEREYGKLCK